MLVYHVIRFSAEWREGSEAELLPLQTLRLVPAVLLRRHLLLILAEHQLRVLHLLSQRGGQLLQRAQGKFYKLYIFDNFFYTFW